MTVTIDAKKLANAIIDDESESSMMGACESEFSIGVVGEYVVSIKLQRVEVYEYEVGSIRVPACAVGIMEVKE